MGAVDACAEAGADLVRLYGSQARGRCWAESDVDFAVLLGSRASYRVVLVNGNPVTIMIDPEFGDWG